MSERLKVLLEKLRLDELEAGSLDVADEIEALLKFEAGDKCPTCGYEPEPDEMLD